MSDEKMTPGEKRAGLYYLCFQFFLLPALLTCGNRLLPEPLGEAALGNVFYVLNFLCAVLLFRQYLVRSLRAFPKNALKNLGTAALLLVVYFAAQFLFSLIVSALYPAFFNVNDQAIAATYSGWYQAVILVLCVPVAEEVLYRGLLFQIFPSKDTFLAASTAIFALIHVAGYVGSYPPIQLFICFLQYLPAGLCLGYAYIRSGSILTPMLMHMAINGVGILQMR